MSSVRSLSALLLAAAAVLLSSSEVRGQQQWHLHQAGQCHINQDELTSTIQATSGRVLQGVCSPHELETRFWSLEANLADRINSVTNQLNQITAKLDRLESDLEYRHRTMTSLVRGRPVSSVTPAPETEQVETASITQQRVTPSSASWATPSPRPSRIRNLVRAQSARLTSVSSNQPTPGADYPTRVWLSDNPILNEVQTYNNTIHTEHGRRVFTYYWRVPDMTHKMRFWATRRSERSPSFYIFPGGYRMYMRVYPRQNGKNVYVHVGLTSGENDDVLDWPFNLQLRAQMLDQNTPDVRQDVSSRVWKPRELCSSWNWRKPNVNADNYECVGLGFPHSVVQSYNYLWRDSLLVKLTTYLDQE